MHTQFGVNHTIRWILTIFLFAASIPLQTHFLSENINGNAHTIHHSSVGYENTDVAFDCSLVTQIPVADCQALVDLYNSTNGNGWTVKTGWVSNYTPCTNWHGITCSAGRVRGINLSQNNLSGIIPASLGNLTGIQTLYLQKNNLTGSIPTTLQNLTALQIIDLAFNNLSGQIPTSLSSLINLRQLNLGFNQLTGSIPAQLGALNNLELLWLMSNQITGTIPPELGNLSKLQQLMLNRNMLTGPIPHQLANLVNLGRLVLANNQLTGPIPVGLYNLTNLSILELQDNQLTGTLSPEIKKLQKLEWFSVAENLLEGTLPSQIAEIKPLKGIFLGNNNFTGTLPSWIGTMKSLEAFEIGNNNFEGRIPSQIGNLTNLMILDISNNNFWGEIPSSITNLTKLNTIYPDAYTDLGHNHLYTINKTVINFLNIKDPDWKETQTPLTDFFDVHPSHWAASFITAILDANITAGCSADPKLYCPEVSVFRGDMAIFLERGMRHSSYIPEPAVGIFDDVPLNAYYAAWVEQLYKDGVTAGCTVLPLKYCPSLRVSRAQMAVFLLRAKYGPDYQPPAAQHIFSDVPKGSFFEPWIEQLAAEGITAGCGVGIYCPTSPVTRAQMAVFLTRAFNLPMP
jgi:Leucine-rich repeat (LRR) protein